MTALKIIGGILLVILLILFIPIRIRLKYTDELEVFVPVLFFKIPIFPRKTKLKPMSKKKYEKVLAKEAEKSTKKERDKVSKEKKKNKPIKDAKKKKISLSDITSLVGEILDAVGAILSKVGGYLRVKIYALHILISSDDAAKTAITYGAVSGTLGTLFGILEDRCHIKYARNAEAGVSCDYTCGSSELKCDVRFTFRIWQLISIAFNAFKKFISIKMKMEVK